MEKFSTDLTLSYTQRQKILRYMEEHGSITVREAFYIGINSPTKRLSEINEKTPLNKEVEYRITIDPSGRKKTTRFVRYSMRNGN